MIQRSRHPNNFIDFKQRLTGSEMIQNNKRPGKTIWRHSSDNSIVLTGKMRMISLPGMGYSLVLEFTISLIPSKNVKAWVLSFLNALGSMTRCNQMIRGKFVNLVDLVDAGDDPSRQVEQFASETLLSEYTLSNHKVFPRNHVAAGSLLKYLLRNILSPNEKRRDPALSRRKKRKNRR